MGSAGLSSQLKINSSWFQLIPFKHFWTWCSMMSHGNIISLTNPNNINNNKSKKALCISLIFIKQLNIYQVTYFTKLNKNKNVQVHRQKESKCSWSCFCFRRGGHCFVIWAQILWYPAKSLQVIYLLFYS